MNIKAQLEQLSSEREDAREKAEELLAAVETNGAALTEEQSQQVDELIAAAKKADAAITELLKRDEESKARLSELRAMEDRTADIQKAGRGVRVPVSPSSEGDGSTKASIRIPARARRHGMLKSFVGEVDGEPADVRAYRFGAWAMAKLERDMPSQFGGRFRNVTQFARDTFGMPLYAAHGEGADDTSGAHVFVPDEFGVDLIRLRETYGIARQVLRMRNMTSDTRTDPRRTGGLTAYFVGEGSAGTESTAAYDNVSLTAKKLMVITRMSSELNEDAVINFGDELAGEISYAFSNKEDECCFNGDGTSTYGGVTGIRTQLDTLTAGTAPGLTLGAGNAYDELTLANFESVVGSLPQYADVPGQVRWICHKTFYYGTMVRLALAAGGTTTTEIVNGRLVPVFMGYPVLFSQVFPSTAANSQIAVVFGNLAMGASFGDRRQETISFSDQATVGGESLWEQDQIAVKGTERFDINVHDFGTNSAAGPICGLELASS